MVKSVLNIIIYYFIVIPLIKFLSVSPPVSNFFPSSIERKILGVLISESLGYAVVISFSL